MDCWDVNNNLTKELNDLKDIYKHMKDVAQKFIMPRIETHSIKEFNKYIEDVDKCLDKIRNYFEYLHNIDTCELIIQEIILIDSENKSIILSLSSNELISVTKILIIE